MSYLRTNYRITGMAIDVVGASAVGDPTTVLPQYGSGYVWASFTAASTRGIFIMRTDETFTVYTADDSGTV